MQTGPTTPCVAAEEAIRFLEGDLLTFVEYVALLGPEPRMRGSAGRIMIRPGQAIMIAWLTTAHAPLWEPAHERAPPKKGASNYATILNQSLGALCASRTGHSPIPTLPGA